MTTGDGDRQDGASELPTKPVDPGLQNERTAMAWQHTNLGFADVGAVLLHSALDDRLTLLVPGLLALVGGGLVVARAQARYRGTATAVRRGLPTADRRAVATTAALTTILCVAGLVAIVLL